MRATWKGKDARWRAEMQWRQEADLLTRAVAFANLRRIKSPEQIKEMFAYTLLLWDTEVEFMDWSDDLAAYERTQQALRDAFRQIASGTAADHRIVEGRAREAFEGLEASAHFVLYNADGMLRFNVPYGLPDLDACCWFAVGLLLDETRPFGQRLNQCGAPGCGKFIFTLSGRPRRHCNDGHRRRFAATTAAERMRRSRAKRQRAKS